MTDEINNPQTPTPENIETPEILAFDYRYISLLGEGANGKTWKAKNRQTGQLVAIKALKLSQSENFKSFELFKREAEVLASVRIQGVPQFYQSVNTDEAGGDCFIVPSNDRVPPHTLVSPVCLKSALGSTSMPSPCFTRRPLPASPPPLTLQV